MPVRLEDNDLGLRAIIDEVEEMAGTVVTVGIHSDAPRHPDGANMADVATFNEFGTRDIPARSFMRSTFDENDAFSAEVEEATGLVIDGLLSVPAAAERIGMQVQAKVQKKIVDLKEPPNKPATIAKKRSSNPLIDTGRMRQSINYKVES